MCSDEAQVEAVSCVHRPDAHHRVDEGNASFLNEVGYLPACAAQLDATTDDDYRTFRLIQRPGDFMQLIIVVAHTVVYFRSCLVFPFLINGT